MKKVVITVAILLISFISSLPSTGADSVSIQIDKIEKSYFGYTFPDDTSAARLNRLEKAVYGTVSKAPANERIKKLLNDIEVGIIETVKEMPTVASSDEPDLPLADKDVKYPIVDKMEQKIFKKTYINEDIYIRLSRLEKEIYKKENNSSLNERVDKLNDSILKGYSAKDFLASDEYDQSNQSSSGYSPNSQYNYFSPENTKNRIARPVVSSNNTENSPGDFDIDILEKNVLGQKFPGETASHRLARLENQVFHRTFNDDDEARVQRLMAATTAQKTSKNYDNNKFSQYLNSGLQIGGVILMILAMIL